MVGEGSISAPLQQQGKRLNECSPGSVNEISSRISLIGFPESHGSERRGRVAAPRLLMLFKAARRTLSCSPPGRP